MIMISFVMRMHILSSKDGVSDPNPPQTSRSSATSPVIIIAASAFGHRVFCQKLRINLVCHTMAKSHHIGRQSGAYGSALAISSIHQIEAGSSKFRPDACNPFDFKITADGSTNHFLKTTKRHHHICKTTTEH